MSDLNVFDGMVDDIKSGEIFIAEFDTGLILSVDFETLSITDFDEEDGFDVILSGEVLDTLHLFLEARAQARRENIDVNWDAFLKGINDSGQSEIPD